MAIVILIDYPMITAIFCLASLLGFYILLSIL